MDYKPGALAEIQYTNAHGRASTRRIRIASVRRCGYYCYIRAYCFFRDEERTFRSDRISRFREIDEQSDPERRTDKLCRVGPIPAAVSGAAGGTERAVVTARPADISQKERNSSNAGYFLARSVLLFIVLLVFLYIRQDGNETPGHDFFNASLQRIVNSGYGKQRTASAASSAGQNGAYNDRNGTNDASGGPDLLNRYNYRGNLIHEWSSEGRLFYIVPAISSAAFKELQAAYRCIDRHLFTAATGIDDSALTLIYEEADRDGNYELSLEEIRKFQKWALARFEYRENTSALSPDRFLIEGGGDCEDWALLTCGLLRYWGYDCRLAVFSSQYSADTGAHALTFLYSPGVPASGDYFTLDAETAFRLSGYSETPAASGCYIPIDYDHVGSLSTAVGPHWTLTRLYCPEEIYGDPL